MTIKKLPWALGILPLMICLTPIWAAETNTNETAKTDGKGETKFFEETPPVITAHSITVGGKTLKYHVTAGFMVLKEEEGKPLVKGAEQKPPDAKEAEANKTKDGLKAKAKIFYIAYTLDDAGDPAVRPVTFAFNGGAGASSGLVPIGLVGARRGHLPPVREKPPPPRQIVG